MNQGENDTFDSTSDQCDILGMFLIGRDITEDSLLQKIDPRSFYSVIWVESKQKWFVTKKIFAQ